MSCGWTLDSSRSKRIGRSFVPSFVVLIKASISSLVSLSPLTKFATGLSLNGITFSLNSSSASFNPDAISG